MIDHGDVGAARQQHLHGDLPEAAKANDKRGAGEPFGWRFRRWRLALLAHAHRKFFQRASRYRSRDLRERGERCKNCGLRRREKCSARRQRKDDE